MATTIATLTAKTDGSLEGIFATIRVNAPIAIVPNASKTSEEAPDYRIIHRKLLADICAEAIAVDGTIEEGAVSRSQRKAPRKVKVRSGRAVQSRAASYLSASSYAGAPC
ncbi:hypothetical protein Rleg9DRAFT_0638 [Rhizobium leguminosarum bv. trifolii WSM597]|uniref:Uncharacterized protein n=1 Tax=Rhizobium leguminosarum bv. trifolii WSM597 TaxID=754764 RepID=J0GWH8_RHILT|nr:hypothetical protein Rleg9DRAFT_0638 [Rhizobium leguminosarum bv. trifolii WSM597]